MIELSFKKVEALYTLLYILFRLIVWIKDKKIDYKKECLMLLMYINIAVILRFTLFPMSRIDGKIQPLIFDKENIFPLNINLEVFVHINDFVDKSKMWMNVIGNILMFVPTGIILPIIFKRLNNIFKVTLSGAFLSLCIEILQLPFPSRSSDIDDLILNTSGVIIGYIIYKLFKRKK